MAHSQARDKTKAENTRDQSKRQIDTLPPIKKWLTDKEAVIYTGISLSRLAGWRMEKPTSGPPYSCIGRSIRYSVDELDAWMRAHQVACTNTVKDEQWGG